jgi:hypothetical protein
LPIHTQKMVEFSVDVGHGLDKNTTIWRWLFSGSLRHIVL